MVGRAARGWRAIGRGDRSVSPGRRRSRRSSTSRASPASGPGRCRVWSRCSTRTSTGSVLLGEAAADAGQAVAGASERSRSRIRIGCARRNRSSARSRIGERLHIVPTLVRAAAGRHRHSPRPGARLRDRLASHDALVPRMVARATARWRVGPRLWLRVGRARHRRGKLGASYVAGTDVDPQALRASRGNAQANRPKRCSSPPDALPARHFDIVVANILANPLILLAPAIAARVRPGGRLALSGILDSQVDAVVIAYSRWFKLAACRRADGWALLSGERSALP